MYITTRLPPRYRQMTFEELISDEDLDLSQFRIDTKWSTKTFKTSYYDRFTKALPRSYDEIVLWMEQFFKGYVDLFAAPRESLYRTYYIPKASGGLRQINAPCDRMMKALTELRDFLDSCMFASNHAAAFAYVRHRSPVDAVRKHQRWGSRWFLKLDFHDFFGSTTQAFLMSMLSQIFPFAVVMHTKRGYDALYNALSLCFLHDGLPQGSPISPFLTNLMMIPFDHEVSNALRKFQHPGRQERYVYTRYADDVCVSCRVDFPWHEVQDYLLSVLREMSAPFSLNQKKTRYGSSNGSNWILGVMLNKDNQITIGHKKKKSFEAALCNYILDHRFEDKRWPLGEVQWLCGLKSHYESIEPEFVATTIRRLSEKFGVNTLSMLKTDLKTL